MSSMLPIAYVYKLSNSEGTKVYYGSTKDIKKRLYKHEYDYQMFSEGGSLKHLSAFEVLSDPNFQFEILETVQNITRSDLHKLESDYIRNNPCVNIHRILADKAQSWKEASKKYRENNKDYISQRFKAYYEHYYEQNKERINKRNMDNYYKNRESYIEKVKAYASKHKDEIATRQKMYREKNKEMLKEKKKEYQEMNKNKISADKSLILDCECGAKLQKGNMAKHKRTKKHNESIQKHITISHCNNATINISNAK